MIIFKKIEDLQKHLSVLKNNNRNIGFVPTMGALHQGHISLINLAQKNGDVVVCSIFVNPTQFNDQQDFEKYPITIDNDIYLLEKENTDILFLPSVLEIYPNGKQIVENYNLGIIENILEGAFRPGHFQGVCQVVDRLLDIVKPETLFLGQKDYQQVMVIKKMIELKNHSTKVMMGETLRESTGLAKSSRNMRLSELEKIEASHIYKNLIFLKENIQHLSIADLQNKVRENLLQNGFEKVDYIAIADKKNLLPIEKLNGNEPVIALIAAFLNGVRLIDNMLW